MSKIDPLGVVFAVLAVIGLLIVAASVSDTWNDVTARNNATEELRQSREGTYAPIYIWERGMSPSELASKRQHLDKSHVSFTIEHSGENIRVGLALIAGGLVAAAVFGALAARRLRRRWADAPSRAGA
jgi:hypothetical protein